MGLAGPERLRWSACKLKVMLPPMLKILACISPLPSVVDASLEIHRDSGGLAMRRRSRRRRSLVLAIFGGIGQFRHRRGGGHAGVVRPAGAPSWLCLGIGPSFFCPIVAHCLEMLFAISAGRILLMNFKLC